jgi:hypothetical protein
MVPAEQDDPIAYVDLEAMSNSTFFAMSSERSTVAIQLVLAKDAAQMYVSGQ